MLQLWWLAQLVFKQNRQIADLFPADGRIWPKTQSVMVRVGWKLHPGRWQMYRPGVKTNMVGSFLSWWKWDAFAPQNITPFVCCPAQLSSFFSHRLFAVNPSNLFFSLFTLSSPSYLPSGACIPDLTWGCIIKDGWITSTSVAAAVVHA